CCRAGSSPDRPATGSTWPGRRWTPTGPRRRCGPPGPARRPRRRPHWPRCSPGGVAPRTA
ncbi:MAG: hypothetical protein AVDCRST_MAG41-1413, partial [uncultured Corynebacteriales bacterium]